MTFWERLRKALIDDAACRGPLPARDEMRAHDRIKAALACAAIDYRHEVEITPPQAIDEKRQRPRRVDFILLGSAEACLVEVKTVNVTAGLRQLAAYGIASQGQLFEGRMITEGILLMTAPGRDFAPTKLGGIEIRHLGPFDLIA